MPGEQDSDEVSLVRGFLGRQIASARHVEADDDQAVRAYLVTNGRTTTSADLSFESMVSLTAQAENVSFGFERGQIIELCRRSAQSIAELAAQLHIPIGAARVLAGDLVNSKVLDVHLPNASFSNDVELIKRLISGVRAL